ncbi:hypothetical protein PMAYCL1PPCAC_21981, partial [Pristionchus mayeri]
FSGIMESFGDFIASIREAVPKELGGKKDKDGVALKLASYIDSIHKKPGTEQFGFGAVAGLVTGYTYAKGNKALGVTLGISLISYQFCSYRGYFKLNRTRIAREFKTVKRCLEQDLNGMSPLELEASKIGSFVTTHGFLLIGFGLGALLACAKS